MIAEIDDNNDVTYHVAKRVRGPSYNLWDALGEDLRERISRMALHEELFDVFDYVIDFFQNDDAVLNRLWRQKVFLLTMGAKLLVPPSNLP